jgi:hypothetical protein
MKKALSNPWIRYAIVFVVMLVLVGGWFRFGPYVDPEGSNLLVNSVIALILTGIYAVIDYFVIRNRIIK